MNTAIVTGASGNLGQAVVRKFLAEGYRVTGTVLHNNGVQINPDISNFEMAAVDLMNEEDSEKFVAAVLAKYQSIDVAVLTAGGFVMGKIADTKTSDIAQQYKLNFETAYNIARPVFAAMLKQKKGRIFLVGSRAGINASSSKGMVSYGLAKSMLFRLAELMNEEAKGTNVVTAVIVPSTIDTPPNRSSMPNAEFDTWVKPEVIAAIIHFYCTEAADGLREPVIKVYNNA